MERPTEAQVTDAIAIVDGFQRTYGLASAENNKRRMVYSVLAALGGPGTVAAEYEPLLATTGVTPKADPDKIAAAAIKDQKVAAPAPWFVVVDDGSALEVVAENEFGIPVGTLFSYDSEDDPEEDEGSAGVPDAATIEAMGFEDLKSAAADENVSVEGLKSKDEVRKAIFAAREQSAKDAEEADNQGS